MRVSDCTLSPRVPDAAEFPDWEQLYDDLIAQAISEMDADPASRQRGSVALNRDPWQANREMCRRLGFAFYGGDWGQPLARLYKPLPRGKAG